MDKKNTLTPEQQEQIHSKIKKAAKDNRIQCASAFAIAKALGIPPQKVGDAANELNIKICKCQLNCF